MARDGCAGGAKNRQQQALQTVRFKKKDRGCGGGEITPTISAQWPDKGNNAS
jgi:hypothetical protein